MTLRSEFQFARQRLASESGENIELCRGNLTARIEKCHLNCDACGAQCISKAVRDIVSVAKCTIALPILGMLQAQHSSDLGLDIASRWGAQRHKQRPPNPNDSWEEKYRVLVQNSVSAPTGPRNSISCRYACARPCRHPPHTSRNTRRTGSRTTNRASAPSTRRSTRTVVLLSARASTCRARPTWNALAAAEVCPNSNSLGCPHVLRTHPFVAAHPISGMHYVCTHNVQLYSQAGYGKDAYRDQVTANVQLKASGEPHPKIWLPDSTNEDYYLLDMPGVLAHLKHSQHHDTRLTQYSCR